MKKITLLTILLFGTWSSLNASTLGKYKEECKNGNIYSCNEVLNERYFLDYDDYSREITRYTIDCESGNAYKCNALGNMYDEKTHTGYDGYNPKQRAEYFHMQACDKDIIESCIYLGDKNYFGYPAPNGGTYYNKSKAAEFYKKSCDAGNYHGCNGLANTYINDKPDKAIELYKKSCAAGIGESCFNIAEMYYNGDHFNKSWEKAKEFYKKASDADYSKASYKYREIDNWNFFDKTKYNMSN